MAWVTAAQAPANVPLGINFGWRRTNPTTSYLSQQPTTVSSALPLDLPPRRLCHQRGIHRRAPCTSFPSRSLPEVSATPRRRAFCDGPGAAVRCDLAERDWPRCVLQWKGERLIACTRVSVLSATAGPERQAQPQSHLDRRAQADQERGQRPPVHCGAGGRYAACGARVG